MRRAQVFFFWKRVETSFARPVTSAGRIHLVEAEVPRFLRVSKHWRRRVFWSMVRAAQVICSRARA
jgi:hypothetical protein